jgi:RNA polymerase sigma factor (sigma-70 family)
MEGSDALLAARLAAGDDRALAEVFDQLAPSVYGGALRVLGNGSAAQDVVQDVFVELWSHPDRYDPMAGSLRTYLIVLARHRAADLLRSELRRVARQERHHRLTPGGGTWDVATGQGMGGDPGQEGVAIVTDAVGFCRLAANRLTPAELGPHITGNAARAAGVLAAATTLALD